MHPGRPPHPSSGVWRFSGKLAVDICLPRLPSPTGTHKRFQNIQIVANNKNTTSSRARPGPAWPGPARPGWAGPELDIAKLPCDFITFVVLSYYTLLKELSRGGLGPGGLGQGFGPGGLDHPWATLGYSPMPWMDAMDGYHGWTPWMDAMGGCHGWMP